MQAMLSDRCLSVCPVLPVTFVHCGQTVGRIKMKLGMQVWPQPWPHCVRWGKYGKWMFFWEKRPLTGKFSHMFSKSPTDLTETRLFVQIS